MVCCLQAALDIPFQRIIVLEDLRRRVCRGYDHRREWFRLGDLPSKANGLDEELKIGLVREVRWIDQRWVCRVLGRSVLSECMPSMSTWLEGRE